MAVSNKGKDDSTYAHLKAFFHGKTIKTIVNQHYFEKTIGVLCQRRKLHLNQITTGN